MKRALVISLFLLSLAVLGAQEAMPAITTTTPDALADFSTDAPAWLLRNWGRAARLAQPARLSDAFLLLTRALEKDPLNPETLTELALVYHAAGDDLQAETQLNLALDNRARLSSRDLQYYILYQLADIYMGFGEERIHDYEQILLAITGDDEMFSSSEEFTVNLRNNIIESLLTRPSDGKSSLDRTIVLYRIDDSFSLEAHRKLGVFYVQTGRYDLALKHLSFATIKIYSRMISRYRLEEPLFSFTSSSDFFSRISRNDEWTDYLQSSGLDEALYYLGAAIYGNSPERSWSYNSMWQAVGLLPFNSYYKSLAAGQLTNPLREALMYGGEQFLNSVRNTP